jgi:hypothetical protein
MIPDIGVFFARNLLEIEVTFFVLLAAISGFAFIQKPDFSARSFLLLSLHTLFVLAAFLAKGPVGLFPLSIFFWGTLCFSQIRQTHFFFSLLVQLFWITAFSVWIVFTPEAFYALDQYLTTQVFASIEGTRRIHEDGRFHILAILFQQLLIPLGIVLAVWIRKGIIQKSWQWIKPNHYVFFFAAIGISGSLPVIASLKQSSFYIIPCYPFWAIAIALYCLQYFENAPIKKSLGKWLLPFSAAFFIVVITGEVIFFGDKYRKGEHINDIKIIAKHFPRNSYLHSNCVCHYTKNQTANYLFRYGYVNLEFSLDANDYQLVDPEKNPPLPSGHYEKMDLGLQTLQVYKR